MAHSCSLHTHTPTLTVIEPRRLPVRTVSFHVAQTDAPMTARVDRLAYDPAGRQTARWDPRLWAAADLASDATSNVSVVFSLSGERLLYESVDAGWRLQSVGEGGQRDGGWDGRGVVQRVEYDKQLRPTALFEEQGARDGTARTCVERLSYGGPGEHHANQCNQIVRHYDPAGSLCNTSFDINRNVLLQARRFLNDPNMSSWPDAAEACDQLLEPGDGARMAWRFAPTGEMSEQRDAMVNTQFFAQTVAGLLKQTRLQLAGLPAEMLVGDIQYDAFNRAVSETAGNGVVTSAAYSTQDARLVNVQSTLPDGERRQDLRYAYDPVGNVISIADASLPQSHFVNQLTKSISTFTYDTLYQLIEATGRELASVNRGPDLAVFQSPIDPSRLTNYRQNYEYDAGGNLLKRSHVGVQDHSQWLAVANGSNRSLAQLTDTPPTDAEIAAAFDANGNLQRLAPGQNIEWNPRNQLRRVTLVARPSGVDDSEVYVYDATGLRVRKIRTVQAKNVVHVNDVRYLPGLEIRANSATGGTLHVITAPGGRNAVRVLHWVEGKPETVDNDQTRYTLSDHLGSSLMELDQQCRLISQESYYPFGGTAWWAGRCQIEAHYKTVRYSGKERDATGLYYYGLRYYAPWLMRWINPDPTGEQGGVNLFCFCSNSPIRYRDSQGAAPYDVPQVVVVAAGMGDFSPQQQAKMRKALDAASYLVAGTRDQLREASPRRDVVKAFDATFGELPASIRSETIEGVVESLDSYRNMLTAFGKPHADLDIELFDGPSMVKGRTLLAGEFEDVVKSFGVSRTHLEQDHVLNVAWTLIHETSHAVNFTVDSHYYEQPRLEADATPEAVGGWSKQIRRSLSRVVRSGPYEKHGSAPVYETSMQGLTDDAANRHQRKATFVGNGSVRSSLLRMNADTFPALVNATRFPERWLRRQV
ncbi:hypothetical protein BBI10_22705 [Pseudomonas graminis]|uniref:RHS repeat protein n=2 Tax=Pseudomonas graminis TaxID=158627 RepID=A0A1C2D8E1_9PSED|nr:hypothetical protein BBI10_22705 [Pseudomonas graminis]